MQLTMNVIVQSLHFDADIKLISFIQEKVGKLALFHDRIISSDVTLRVGSESERPENKYVELRAGVAQLVEHQPSKLRVAGSNLVSRSTPGACFQGPVDHHTKPM
jgi:ribosome-associated translation inhibitor RaiA